MLRRSGHLHIVTILNTKTRIVVASGRVSVSVVAIETEATESWSDETEVTLVSCLNTIYTSIVGIHVLCHLEGAFRG